MPRTLGHSGIPQNRTIIKSVIIQYTKYTPVFPWEEPKPTNIFQGSALSSMCYRMQDPKLKAFPCSYIFLAVSSSHPGKLLQAILSGEQVSQSAGSGSLGGSEWSHPGGGESIWTWRVSCFSSSVIGVRRSNQSPRACGRFKPKAYHSSHTLSTNLPLSTLW